MISVAHESSLFLRPWHLTDAQDLWSLFQVNPDLRALLPKWPNMSDVQEWIEDSWIPGRRYTFVLCSDDRPLGQIRLRSVDEGQGTATLTYWSVPAIRGHGWTARAAATIADWGLGNRDLHRLELSLPASNNASFRVAQRAGFVEEGLQRERVRDPFTGERVGVRVLGRLASDPWPSYEPLDLYVHNPERTELLLSEVVRPVRV